MGAKWIKKITVKTVIGSVYIGAFKPVVDTNYWL
jgi:hypothetical protein